MAQINIASFRRTMTAVFVEITYQMHKLKAKIQCFGKNEIYFKGKIEYIDSDIDTDVDRKTCRMIQSIVPDPENNPMFIAAMPDHCVR